MVHLEGTCGWDGKEVGRRWGKEPSYPTRPLPVSELPPRHRAVALPSQPCPSSTPDGCRKEGTWAGKMLGWLVPGGAKVRRQGRSAASFCKREWHGGSVARLRAVGEAKDVIVQLLPPSGQRYLCRQVWLGGCPAEGSIYIMEWSS